MNRPSARPDPLVSSARRAYALCAGVALSVVAAQASAIPSEAGLLQVRVGQFAERSAAVHAADRLRQKGFDAFVPADVERDYFVSTGVFSRRANALRLRNRLSSAGFAGVRVASLQSSPVSSLPPQSGQPAAVSVAPPIERPGEPLRTAAQPLQLAQRGATARQGDDAARGKPREKVLEEYYSRSFARRQLEVLKEAGRDVELRLIEKEIQLTRLFVGVLPSRSEASSVAARLKAKRIAFRVKRVPQTRGYVIVLGSFKSAQTLAGVRERVEALGIRNLRTESVTEKYRQYQLVEMLPPAAPEPAPKPPVRVVEKEKEAPEEPVARPTRDQFGFTSHEAAQAHAEDLRRAGKEVRVRKIEARAQLQQVQLRPYPQWAEAQQVAQKLGGQGIDADVVSDRFGRGYAVSAGDYTDLARLRERVLQVQDLGFTNIQIVSTPVRVARFRVQELGVPAPAPAAPEPAPEAIAAAPAAVPKVLVFGTAGAPGVSVQALAPEEDRGFSIGVDELRVEAGGFTDSARGADSSNYLHGAFSARWRPNNRWELLLAGRVDGYYQTGDPQSSRTELDYGDSFIRYRGDKVRITAGAQTVIWGRVDEIPPTDRLSVQDLSRYLLDEIDERRRAAPVIRLEAFHRGFKADLVWLPEFRAAELPDGDNVWSPVDQVNGRLAGVPTNPLLAPLVRRGRIGDDDDGEGGFGARLSHTGQRVDYGVTVQHVRQSAPYFALNPAVRRTLVATGGNVAAALAAGGGADTFTGMHPRTWVAGGDLGFAAAGATWRFEAAYLSDVPVTRTNLAFDTVEGVEWVAGVEFYPGDGNARVNLQLSGRNLRDTPDILDRDDIYNFNGELENVFANNRWRAKLRFAVGLDEHDVYLNPQIAYVGREPHEFYVGYHHFEGADETLNGFYEDNDLITLGWRASF